jgi:transcriptional regulator with XRE-family HTH domain
VKEHSPRKYYSDDAFLWQVGKRIRAARKKKNVSIVELAKGCVVDYSQVNRMELGKVAFGISYLNKVAAALGVNPQELLP